MKLTTKKIAVIGMLCAMAMVVNLLVYFPIVPAVSFLKYDPKDIVIVIGGFMYGPGASFVMSAISSVLEIFFRGGTIIDVLMNMISTCTFACTAAYFYKRHHTKKGALIGLALGTTFATLSMLLWNYIMTPIYFQMPREAVVKILLPGILPFNVLKCALNAGVTLFLYKPVVNVFRHTSLVDRGQEGMEKTHGMVYLGIFICLSVILLLCGIQGMI